MIYQCKNLKLLYEIYHDALEGLNTTLPDLLLLTNSKLFLQLFIKKYIKNLLS